MSEEPMVNPVSAQEAPQQPVEQAQQTSKPPTPEEIQQKIKETRDRMARGTLALDKPIRAGGEDVTELDYDFTRLTGLEYARAMSDAGNTDIYKINAVQAFNLFCISAEKQNMSKKVAAIDIMRDMGAADAVKAVQVASLFFVLASRTAKNHSSN